MATITVKDASNNDVIIQQPLAPGQASMAASVPVVIAVDQTAVPISDGGNVITVDGTVAATQSGTWTVSQGGGAWASTQSGAWSVGQTGTWNITNISGTVSLPTGAATATKQDSIVTAVNATTTAVTAGTVGTGVPGTPNTTTVLSIQGEASMTPVKDISAERTDAIYNNETALTPKFAVISAASSGNNTLVASVSGKKIRVLAYNFMGNGAVNAKFQSGASGTDLTGLKYIAAAGGGLCAPYNPLGWFETAATTLLNINLSGAIAVGGELVYVEV